MGGGGAGEVQLQSNSLLLFISHYHAGELLVLAFYRAVVHSNNDRDTCTHPAVSSVHNLQGVREILTSINVIQGARYQFYELYVVSKSDEYFCNW